MNATSTKTTNDSDLWAGTDNSQRYGDDLGVKSQATVGRFQRKPIEYVYVPPPVTTPVTPPGTIPATSPQAASDNWASFFANNKLIVFGGIAAIAYLLFSNSLGAQDRTVTSITRYAPRKSR